VTPGEILNKAADLLEPDGAWTQIDANLMATCPGGTCAALAIGAVASDVARDRALTAFSQFLGYDGSQIHIWHWNDDPSRTQAEVVAKLREAAQSAECGR